MPPRPADPGALLETAVEPPPEPLQPMPVISIGESPMTAALADEAVSAPASRSSAPPPRRWSSLPPRPPSAPPSRPLSLPPPPAVMAPPKVPEFDAPPAAAPAELEGTTPPETISSPPRRSQRASEPELSFSYEEGELELGERTSAPELELLACDEISTPPPRNSLPPPLVRSRSLEAPPRAPSAPPPPPSHPAAPVSASIAPPPPKRPRPWWEDLFGEDFAGTLETLTPMQVLREATFIEESLGIETGANVLDLACGAGQHAVELASRGYDVAGLDLSPTMLARAAEGAAERRQQLQWFQGDMRELAFESGFDGIFCWGSSFGYFDEEKNLQVARLVHRALRRGGRFLLDVVNRDFVAAQQPRLVWFEGKGCVCIDETNIDFITSRLKVKRTVMLENGRSRELDYSLRLYALHELGRLLHEVGFRVTEVSGHPTTPGVFFGPDSPRIIVLAEKA